jgi:hypothetical protein
MCILCAWRIDTRVDWVFEITEGQLIWFQLYAILLFEIQFTFYIVHFFVQRLKTIVL